MPGAAAEIGDADPAPQALGQALDGGEEALDQEAVVEEAPGGVLRLGEVWTEVRVRDAAAAPE